MLTDRSPSRPGVQMMALVLTDERGRIDKMLIYTILLHLSVSPFGNSASVYSFETDPVNKTVVSCPSFERPVTGISKKSVPGKSLLGSGMT